MHKPLIDLTQCIQPIKTANGMTIEGIHQMAQSLISMAATFYSAGYERHATSCCNMADDLLDEVEFLNNLPRVAYKV